MSSSQRIIATTHPVDQMILTVESLEENAERLNTHPRKPAILIEHDKLCPPVGQIVSARVIPINDGHFALIGGNDMFPNPSPITLPNGESGFVQSSEKNLYPFWHGHFHHPESFCVSIDPQNLGGMDGYSSLIDELQRLSGTTWESYPSCRRSILPDPIITFTLGVTASAALWIGARMGKAAGDVLEKELKGFLEVLVAAAKQMATAANPLTRPVDYVLEIHGEPNVELVARTRDADLVIRAMMASSLEQVKKEADSLRVSLSAEFVQLVLSEDGSWKFNYLLTDSGKIIGTRVALDRRATQLKSMNAAKQSKV